jgi:esterase/lipase
MGKDIYDNLASTKKSLWTVKDSEHVGMWNDYNEEYCSKLLELMQNP